MTEKEIKRLAKALPAVERFNTEVHWVKGWELIEQGHTEEVGTGEKIIAERVYEQKMPVILEINHKRIMRKLNDKRGTLAVVEYFNQVMALHENTTSKNPGA